MKIIPLIAEETIKELKERLEKIFNIDVANQKLIIDGTREITNDEIVSNLVINNFLFLVSQPNRMKFTIIRPKEKFTIDVTYVKKITVLDVKKAISEFKKLPLNQIQLTQKGRRLLDGDTPSKDQPINLVVNQHPKLSSTLLF